MVSPTRRPTEAELAILRVLWTDGPLSVREIQKSLNGARSGQRTADSDRSGQRTADSDRSGQRTADSGQKVTGYTTVLKLIQIMTEKGLVDRDESQRPQIYRARHSQEKTQRQLVHDLLDRAFGGSVKTLVLQALDTSRSTPAELEAIEKMLDRMEGESK